MPDSPVLTEEQQKAWARFKEIYEGGGVIVAAPDVYDAIVEYANANRLSFDRFTSSRSIQAGTMIAMRVPSSLPSYQINWDSDVTPLYHPLTTFSTECPEEARRAQAKFV